MSSACHFHKQSASLVTGIVHHQRHLLSGISGLDFLQKFADDFCIYRTACQNTHGIMATGLNGDDTTVMQPPASTRHKDPDEGLNHAQRGPQYEVGGNKKTTLTLLCHGGFLHGVVILNGR
jgi:hypothetical protein